MHYSLLLFLILGYKRNWPEKLEEIISKKVPLKGYTGWHCIALATRGSVGRRNAQAQEA